MSEVHSPIANWHRSDPVAEYLQPSNRPTTDPERPAVRQAGGEESQLDELQSSLWAVMPWLPSSLNWRGRIRIPAPPQGRKANPPVHGAKIARLLNTTRARTAPYSQYFCEPSGDTEPSDFR